ncbi:hypothetical protein [Maricaulis parjimensis]|uniref:hypothetical protein n=1 Tax=Maricaulis parjimensis TaxID=144023 RepID=UPI00193A5087|nr:hypothetical protein [Maricaulis parjimensis]
MRRRLSNRCSLAAASALALGWAMPVLAQPTPLDADAWRADADALVSVLEAEHENPFFHTPETEFRAAVEAYKAGVPEMDRAERIAGLAHILALVGDGHSWMPMHALPFDGLPPGPGFHSLPVRFELFDDGLYIVGATGEWAGLAGARVTAIGHVDTAQAVARTMDLLPTDAVNLSREFVAEWLMQAELLTALDLALNADNISLTVEQDGHSHTVVMQPLPGDAVYDWIFSMDTGPAGADNWVTAAQQVPAWRIPVSEPFAVRPMEDALYLRIDQIQNGSQMSYADAARSAVEAAELMEHPALILDLRRCLGGDGSLNDEFMAALSASEALMQEGRLQVLTSRQTHSAAVMLVSDLEQQTPARFYGQATADRPNHHGETNIFVTPNSLLPVIHASEYYQTSTPDDDRPFVTPDVVIPYLFSDYQAGTDPVLAAALADLEG